MLHTNILGVSRPAAVAEITWFYSLDPVNVITSGGQNALVPTRRFSGFVGTHVGRPKMFKKGGGLSTYIRERSWLSKSSRLVGLLLSLFISRSLTPKLQLTLLRIILLPGRMKEQGSEHQFVGITVTAILLGGKAILVIGDMIAHIEGKTFAPVSLIEEKTLSSKINSNNLLGCLSKY